MKDIDLIDGLIEEMPDLDTLLSRAGMNESDALKAALHSRGRYSELLNKTGLSGLCRPLLWTELFRQCEREISAEHFELLIMLIAGGEALYAEYDCDDDLICAWLESSRRQSELSQTVKTKRKKAEEFAQLSEKISQKRRKFEYAPLSGASAAFRLFCLDDYAADNADLNILSDNLLCIDSMIDALGLKAAAPLVYFQVYCKNRRKLYEKQYYTPTPHSLFKRENYITDRDNGKNFTLYTLYITLYLELKECFPDADADLCDAGFLACSNLAEWCGENIELTYDMPCTYKTLINLYSPMCFGNPENEIAFWKNENITAEQLLKWQTSMTAVKKRAEAATETLAFDMLPELISDSGAFLVKVFGQSTIGNIINPGQLYAARAVLMAEIQRKFDMLLEDKLSELLRNTSIVFPD